MMLASNLRDILRTKIKKSLAINLPRGRCWIDCLVGLVVIVFQYETVAKWDPLTHFQTLRSDLTAQNLYFWREKPLQTRKLYIPAICFVFYNSFNVFAPVQ